MQTQTTARPEAMAAKTAIAAAMAAPIIAASDNPDGDGWEQVFADMLGACERDPLAQRCYDRRAASLKGLAAEAAAASAAAATGEERAVIEAIFAAIPESIAKCQAHADAETTDADDEQDRNEEWMRADAAVRTLSSALLDLPPCSAADTLRRIRLSARVRYLTDGAVTDGVDPAEMAEEDVQEVATAALRALEQAAAPPPAPEWEAAKAAYITARADADTANARAQAALAQLEESHPVPDILCLSDGRRYFLESHIERDVREPFRGNRRLSLDEAAEKLAALRQFTPLYEAESERLGVERLEGEYDAALCRQGQLANALINTPAPTAEAVLEKLQVMTYEFHGVETADDVSELLTGDDPDAWVIARVMQDLMRLTGSASPLANVEPFDAEAFIASFECEPGCASAAAGPSWTPDEETGPFPGLAEWSALKDWQKRAVRDQAKRRDRAAAAETQQRGAGPTIASPKPEGD